MFFRPLCEDPDMCERPDDYGIPKMSTQQPSLVSLRCILWWES